MTITQEDITEFEKRMDRYSVCCGVCSDFFDAIGLAKTTLEEMLESAKT